MGQITMESTKHKDSEVVGVAVWEVWKVSMDFFILFSTFRNAYQ